jgi:hypothetical protein
MKKEKLKFFRPQGARLIQILISSFILSLVKHQFAAEVKHPQE